MGLKNFTECVCQNHWLNRQERYLRHFVIGQLLKAEERNTFDVTNAHFKKAKSQWSDRFVLYHPETLQKEK